MHCPLCNGPVHEEENGFRCAVGHAFTPEEMVEQTNTRLSVALWMAIEALDNEANVLRRTTGHEQAETWADEAAAQARTLRDFASDHAPRDADDLS